MAEIPDEPVPPVVRDIGVPKWVLEKYKTVGCGDNPWQQRARLLQSLWRERHGWSCGARPLSGGARVLGSMLEESVGRQGGNFVTPAARNAAEDAVASKEAGAVIEEERLSTNLLSSQPLCFNLFADLHRTEKLAEVLASLLPRLDIDTIEEVKYEHSPGRGVAAYTGDRSAIDVAVVYRRLDGRRGLLGFEVKYHENLDSKETLDPAKVMDLVDPNSPDGVNDLRRAPLAQFARDQLLVRAVGRVDSTEYRLVPPGFCCFRARTRRSHAPPPSIKWSPRHRTWLASRWSSSSRPLSFWCRTVPGCTPCVRGTSIKTS